MTNLFTYFSKNVLSLVVGPRMDREWTGIRPMRFIAVLAMMLCFSVGEMWADKWVKVTSAPASWAGEYLLVYENNSTTGYVWTGADAANCYTSATISNGEIASKPASAVSITIAAVTGGYSIKVNGGTNNGKYISGTSGSNTINFNVSAGVNTISYSSSSSDIASNTSHMRWNTNRFRYYQSSSYSSQSTVQLYKKAEAVAYTVTFTKTDGSTEAIKELSVGAGVTPPTMDATCGDWEFQGWSTSESDDEENTDELTTVTLSAGKYYPSDNTTLYPVYTKEGTVENDVEDEITQSTSGLCTSGKSCSGYGNWSGKQETSDAVYAGNSCKGVTYIQIRKSDNSGIITTTSGGILKSVEVEWNSNTTTGRYVTVYGKKTAYTETSNLYDENIGTSLGTIEYGTSTLLDDLEDDEYTYVGIKASNPIYIDQITITWMVEEDVTYYYSYPDCSAPTQVATPTFSVSEGTYIGAQSVELSCATDGATIYYTTNNSTPTESSTEYTGAIDVSSSQTIKAIAVKDGLEDSEVASATYTIRSCKSYSLVTDASSLGIGDKIVILETGGTCAMSTTQNTNNRGTSTDYVLSGSTVKVPDVGTVQSIDLEAYADGYWYFNVGGDNYLAATGSSSAFLKTQGKSTVTTNTTGKWSIALASSTFTVKTNDGPSYNTMRYNSSSTIFTCYSSATQTAVKVYVYSNTSPTIQTNPTSLSGFSATYGGSASDAQNVYVCGRNLTGNITVTPPTGYEVKKSSDGSYSSSAITLSPTNGKVSVTLNVRLAAGNNAGDYNGNLTLVGYNSEASTNVALTGNVAKMTPVITFTLDETAALANTAVDYTLSSTSDATDLTFSYVRGGSAVSAMITNDTENKTISISEAGTYKIRVNQAADANHNAAAQVERELTITVRDVFKDLVNGYSDINGDDTGSGITTPTFAEMEDGTQNACHSTTRYLIGWIKASDLSTIYSGETGYLEDAAAYESNKARLVAPGAATTASGVTWYAVWAEEE